MCPKEVLFSGCGNKWIEKDYEVPPEALAV